MYSTYLIIWIFIANFKCIHGPNHSIHSHENILVNNLDETTLIILRVPRAMNNSHLFDECALPTLSSTCKKSRERTQFFLKSTVTETYVLEPSGTKIASD